MGLMRIRSALAAVSLAAAAVVLAACSGGPGGTPAPTTVPTGSSTPDPGPDLETAATWLDGGRLVGLVTFGSSSCVPQVGDVSAEGQQLTVELVSTTPADAVCTADYSPRAVAVAVPDGVDPTKDVVISITGDEAAGQVALAGDPAMTAAGTPTDYRPSAGWYSDAGAVLLTWGSSSCVPEIERAQIGETGATLTFRDLDRPCTMDMQPRATVVGLGGTALTQEGYVLTLTGGGLDGEVTVGGALPGR